MRGYWINQSGAAQAAPVLEENLFTENVYFPEVLYCQSGTPAAGRQVPGIELFRATSYPGLNRDENFYPVFSAENWQFEKVYEDTDGEVYIRDVSDQIFKYYSRADLTVPYDIKDVTDNVKGIKKEILPQDAKAQFAHDIGCIIVAIKQKDEVINTTITEINESLQQSADLYLKARAETGIFGIQPIGGEIPGFNPFLNEQPVVTTGGTMKQNKKYVGIGGGGVVPSQHIGANNIYGYRPFLSKNVYSLDKNELVDGYVSGSYATTLDVSPIPINSMLRCNLNNTEVTTQSRFTGNTLKRCDTFVKSMGFLGQPYVVYLPFFYSFNPCLGQFGNNYSPIFYNKYMEESILGSIPKTAYEYKANWQDFTSASSAIVTETRFLEKDADVLNNTINNNADWIGYTTRLIGNINTRCIMQPYCKGNTIHYIGDGQGSLDSPLILNYNLEGITLNYKDPRRYMYMLDPSTPCLVLLYVKDSLITPTINMPAAPTPLSVVLAKGGNF